jgi:hypothetical protein
MASGQTRVFGASSTHPHIPPPHRHLLRGGELERAPEPKPKHHVAERFYLKPKPGCFGVETV